MWVKQLYQKENLPFFLSSKYKAQCTMLWFSQFRTHFINKSIFNSTKRNSRQPDRAIFQHVKENNLHQRQEHWSVVFMVGDRWIAVCPIYIAVRAHIGPQYRLNLTDAFVSFHACQRQEVISLVRLSSSHYQNHKSKENIWEFTVPNMCSHAHFKAHHSSEIGNN